MGYRAVSLRSLRRVAGFETGAIHSFLGRASLANLLGVVSLYPSWIGTGLFRIHGEWNNIYWCAWWSMSSQRRPCAIRHLAAVSKKSVDNGFYSMGCVDRGRFL